MESRIERLCVERGLKMTGQRRVIARVLSEASDHPDVEELYRRSTALDARASHWTAPTLIGYAGANRWPRALAL